MFRSFRKEGGIVTKHFSYPEGLAHCYNETVINCLKTFGISLAYCGRWS